MIPTFTPQEIIALVVSAIGAVWDVRTTKIPNWLTFPAAILGLAINAFKFGLAGAVASVIAWSIPIIVWAVVFFTIERRLRKKEKKPILGGGDYKLFAAMGAILANIGDLGMAFFYFCLCFGLFSLYQIPWFDIMGMLMSVRTGKVPSIPSSVKDARKKPLQVGPAIALGLLLAILLREPTARWFTGP